MTIPQPADSHGSSLTFSGITMNIISITLPTIKRGVIDATHLGTTGAMNSIPAKLPDGGEISFEAEFDPAAVPPIGGAAAALTVYIAATTPVTWSWASAFLVSVKLPNLKTGEKLTGSYTFKLNSVPTVV